jgi:hypothetical protein
MKQPGKVELIGIGLGSFLLMAALVLIISPPEVDTTTEPPVLYAPTEASAPVEGAEALRITLDCRHREHYVHVDLDAGEVVPETSAAWDLSCRRHVLTCRDGERTPKWYRYKMAAHRLESRGEEFELRSSEGTTFGVTPESYYCDDGIGGCVTLRYRELVGSDPDT